MILLLVWKENLRVHLRIFKFLDIYIFIKHGNGRKKLIILLKEHLESFADCCFSLLWRTKCVIAYPCTNFNHDNLRSFSTRFFIMFLVWFLFQSSLFRTLCHKYVLKQRWIQRFFKTETNISIIFITIWSAVVCLLAVSRSVPTHAETDSNSTCR